MIRRGLIILTLILLGYFMVTQQGFQAVAAGVAIFLFGMMFMEQGFKALTGSTLKRILSKATDNIFKSQLFGFVATALMQSSSLVTVITISTLTAGLIPLAGGIGIIFGSNLGTTTGAWIMAGFGLKVNISQYAMPMIVMGLVLLFQKSQTWKGFGNLLAGIGFVFLGIHYMKEGFDGLSQSFDLAEYAIPGLKGLLIYTLIGMAATVVMQSSHAALMITIAALAAGQITYDNALALAIGSNIGTTVTALLGALGANAQGKRLAWAHVLFNVITGLIAIVFLSPFRMAVDGIADAVGIAPDNWTLRLATFHTLFNIVGVALMTPFIGVMVRQLEKRVKDRPVEREEGVALEPQFLNKAALEIPDAAVEVLLKESEHLFTNVFEVVAHGLNLHRTDILSNRDITEVVEQSTEIMDIDITDRYYNSVKILYNAIIDFASRAPTAAKMDDDQIVRVHAVRLACRDAAEIVKTLALIRPNLNRYMQADNAAIRKQYNGLREMMGGCLRAVGQLGPDSTREQVSSTIEAAKSELKDQDALANGTIDRLVREQGITPAMATSFMNDSAASVSICRALIEIVHHLAAARGIGESRVL